MLQDTPDHLKNCITPIGTSIRFLAEHTRKNILCLSSFHFWVFLRLGSISAVPLPRGRLAHTECAGSCRPGRACLSRPGELPGGPARGLFAWQTVEPPGKELILEEEGTRHKQLTW